MDNKKGHQVNVNDFKEQALQCMSEMEEKPLSELDFTAGFVAGSITYMELVNNLASTVSEVIRISDRDHKAWDRVKNILRTIPDA